MVFDSAYRVVLLSNKVRGGIKDKTF